MALSSQNFVKGTDFTGLTSITASDLNQAVDAATLKSDTASEGKGLILWTKDSALDTPIVPDPSAVTTAWKRFIWVRIPYSSATSQTPIVYGWNDNATSDATYLKWLDTAADLTTIEADIAELQSHMTTAQTSILTAAATANSASTLANTANNNATSALSTGTTAAANATTALSDAADAAADASAASAAASAAQTTATAAQSTATAANTAATANRNVKYVKFTETQNKGTNAGAAVTGKNTRVLNTEDNDAGNLASVAGTGVVTLAAGTYQVHAWSTAFNITAHQLLLVKDSDNSTLLTGSSARTNNNDINDLSHLSGLITLSAATAIRLDDYFGSNSGATDLGKACNVHPDGGGKEVYALLELIKLD